MCNLLIIGHYVVEWESVGYVMHNGHEENWANQIKKKLVVLLPNAVVDVATVVVEVVDASIAGATVFCCW
jgi:hypothetical protein